ncbi:hypothetical protein B0H19DRAFT_1245807 [Mycena capillaripes]|nr:hypothetical protein B0H19DRAFT_1245807 [Mycena capillaripes]
MAAPANNNSVVDINAQDAHPSEPNHHEVSARAQHQLWEAQHKYALNPTALPRRRLAEAKREAALLAAIEPLQVTLARPLESWRLTSHELKEERAKRHQELADAQAQYSSEPTPVNFQVLGEARRRLLAVSSEPVEREGARQGQDSDYWDSASSSDDSGNEGDAKITPDPSAKAEEET